MMNRAGKNNGIYAAETILKRRVREVGRESKLRLCSEVEFSLIEAYDLLFCRGKSSTLSNGRAIRRSKHCEFHVFFIIYN